VNAARELASCTVLSVIRSQRYRVALFGMIVSVFAISYNVPLI